jgi:dTDP-glucose 4,6-dehydratase
MKTIMITGGLGFIGRNLITTLLNTYNVINIDNKKIIRFDDIFSTNKNYKLINKDIVECNFISLLNEYTPDILVHLAANTHVDNSINDPSNFIKTNIIGSFNVIEGIRKYNKELKYIHVSTDEVFGSSDNDEIFNETSKYNPNNPYSASKASSDLLVRSYYKTYNIPAIIVNMTNTYGLWQYPEKLIPLTIYNLTHNNKVKLYGNGKNKRDWIHISDTVGALFKIIKYGINGKRYNVSSGNTYTNIEIVSLIYETLMKKNVITIDNDYIEFIEDRKGHDYKYNIDSSFIRKTLLWEPVVDINYGIFLTVSWYLSNIKWLEQCISEINEY